MKKRHYLSVVAMMIIVSMIMCTGCGSAKTLSTINPDKYVTLGEYKGITVSAEDTSVSDAELEAQIKTALEGQATKDPVTDRAVEDGDIVNIDYAGTKNGVSFDGGTGNYDLEIGSGSFIEGFEDGVKGMNIGETKDLNLTFPADYSNADLAGQDVVFKVTVNSISVNNVPELSDAIVPTLNANCKTVDEYKAALKKSIEDSKKTSAEQSEKTEILDKAVSNADCDETKIPKWLVSENETQYIASVESFASQYGMSMAQYISAIGSTQEAFNKEAEDYSRELSKKQLVIRAIAKAENIALSANEVDDEYQNYATQYGTDVETLKKEVSEDIMSQYLLTNHVEDFLLENAKIVKQ